MDIFYIEFLLLLLCLLSFYYYVIHRSRQTSPITDWPVLGMTPELLRNAHRVHDFATDMLRQTQCSFHFKGPWFCNLDLFVTSDPANIHHILSKNFSNYPKGPEFRKIFEILGDGIFNSDDDLWELHRKVTMSLFNHLLFYRTLQHNIKKKVENGLTPVLEFVSEKCIEVDLQEIFQRFTFDTICSLILDYDPRSLSADFPYIACEKAFTVTEEALLYRHIVPESIWKLQNWIGIGKEKSLTKSWVAFDQFIYQCLKTKRGVSEKCEAEEEDLGMLSKLMEAYKEKTGNTQKFLRDTLLNLMIAGRDTTSTALTWFFWLLSQNPLVEKKILEEIKTKLNVKDDETNWRSFDIAELRKLVYLHGALCEALRLYPPVALEHKAPVRPDVLPSGHPVDPSAKIVLSFYSMGRMESIWGKDCMEFKPERWISERGGIKHEPSYKFPAFNAGPRTCVGKEMAFAQMKIVAVNVICNYQIQVIEGHPIVPGDSIILQMKYGLKVKIAKRNV